MNPRGGAEKSERTPLKVLYDFEYETRGKEVSIKKDEKLLLICKTNVDWWQVVRPSEIQNTFVPEQSTFYVPSGYVTEVKEELLPESTRFYIDKEKMFSPSTTNQNVSFNQDQNKTNDQVQKIQIQEQNEKELRKGHDSFRSVLRKFSGSSSGSDNNKPAKAPKPPPKVTKNSKKHSETSEEIKTASNKSNIFGISKNKHEPESSTFGMCFGKGAEARSQNPFQEELEHAIVNRSHKKIVINNKLGVNDIADHVHEDVQNSKPESAKERWEKSIAQVIRKPEDNPNKLPKVTEDNTEQMHRRSILPSEIKKETVHNNNLGDLKKPSEKPEILSVLEKAPKKPPRLIEPKPPRVAEPLFRIDITKTSLNSNFIIPDRDKFPTAQLKRESEEKSPEDVQRIIEIENLISDLIQASANSNRHLKQRNKALHSIGNESIVESNDKNVRQLQNAETQVNLLENEEDNDSDTKDSQNNESHPDEINSKDIFDFNPRTSIVISKPVTARSPKLFDEYNEANILSDNDNKNVIIDSIRKNSLTKNEVTVVSIGNVTEPPSYSNVSVRLKRSKVPSKLKIPTRDFREELKLTSSLEKLASESQFISTGRRASDQRDQKSSLDKEIPDSTIASLSHDSLRLYKRRSKSDGALNKQDPSKLESSHDSSNNTCHARSLDTKDRIERKYTQNEIRGVRPESTQQNSRRVCEKLSSVGRSDKISSAARYKLSRKSKSLGDLDRPEADGCMSGGYNTNSKRRYKPVPKVRTKHSFKRVKPALPPSPPISPMIRSTNSVPLTKPIPAKRRIFAGPKMALPENGNISDSNDNNNGNFKEVDIEKSTAVGFKSLLRASESGSEEILQYKTFPCSNSNGKEYEPGIFRSDGNVHLSGKTLHIDPSNGTPSRSVSDEMILKSTISSGSAGMSLDDTWTTCSSPGHDDDNADNLDLPPGWTQSYDVLAKRACYINYRGDKWFSSYDSEGKIYFFEENSNESSWSLPPVFPEERMKMVSNSDWPQLSGGIMSVIKEGPINKTKLTSENGKKVRKHWTSSYAVLTELFLLFFKDSKTYAAMKIDKSATAKPDISVDLNGASIEPAEKLSNRKNVYLISTLLGLQVLIHCDTPTTSQWYQEISNAIKKLPFSQGYRKSFSGE